MISEIAYSKGDNLSQSSIRTLRIQTKVSQRVRAVMLMTIMTIFRYFSKRELKP